MQYKINRPRVIHEAFDDEVVIVNFEDGSYFSLNPPGMLVWAALDEGRSVEEVADALAAHYQAERTQIEPALAALIQDMSAARLILPAEGERPAPPPLPPPQAPRKPFDPPRLSRYTDMQELLLLDPVHEVDDTGWPNRPQA